MVFAGYFSVKSLFRAKPWAGAGLGCLALIWRLAAGNWARTLLWTIRAALALIMLGIDCI